MYHGYSENIKFCQQSFSRYSVHLAIELCCLLCGDSKLKTKTKIPNSAQERQALTLDCGNHWPGGPESENPLAPKKPTGPPKTCNDPNVFAAGIYDFTREVAHVITKNKYELTLPSEFCRFPVKIMAAYEALTKKTTGPTGQWKINCGGPNWPDSLKKACGTAGT